MSRQQRERLRAGVSLLAAAGMLAFFALRLHRLDAIPLFIDEAIAVERAGDVAGGAFLHHAAHGKFLQPYMYLLFQAQHGALFVARTITLLLACVGAAAGIAIGCRYGGLSAGILTFALLAFSPMLHFFQRLSLADACLSAILLLWVWWLLRLQERDEPRVSDAMVSAALFIAALLFKATTLYLLPLPLAIALLLTRWSRRERMQMLVAQYLTMLALWLPFALALASRGIDYFGQYGNLGAATSSLLDAGRMAANLRSMLDGLAAYHEAPFLFLLIAICIAGIWLRSRIMLALLAAGLGFGLAQILFGGARFFRYFLPMLPFLLVAAGIALSAMAQRRRRILPLAYGLLCLWIITFAAPQLQRQFTDPYAASMPTGDRIAYFEADSAGFGIRELAGALEGLADEAALTVEGAIANCAGLRLTLAHEGRVTAQCPNVLSGGRRSAYLNDYLPQQAERHDRYYLALEAPGKVSLGELTTVDLTALASFTRPGGKSVLTVYRVE